MKFETRQYIIFLITITIIISIIGYILKKNIKNIFKNIANYIKHIWTLKYVLGSLTLIYFFCYKNNYKDMLPNIISTGLSIVIIDYLLKAREESSKIKLKQIAKQDFEKINNEIIDLVKNIFSNESFSKIKHEDISNVIANNKFENDEIEYICISNGNIDSKKVCKLDYIYYKVEGIRKNIESIIKNFKEYLEYKEIEKIIELEKILNKRIFKVKFSDIETKNPEDVEAVKVKLITTTYEVIKQYKKIKL